MILPALYFGLGAACAVLLAVFLVPALLRRAERLTRKRVEAMLPMTLNEIQAGRDQIRAQAALEVRRAEIEARSFRDRATALKIELGRKAVEIDRLAVLIEEKNKALARIEAERTGLAEQLAAREAELLTAGAELAEARRGIEAQRLEAENLARLHEEASFLASDRQIALAGREAEIDNLTVQLNALRAEGRDREAHLVEAAAENARLREAIAVEQRRMLDAEARVERMLTTVTDREEQLERRVQEIARLREQIRAVRSGQEDMDAKLAAERAERLRLEAELGDTRPPVAGAAAGGDDEILREQIAILAAQVVSLTARLEGPESPINKAVPASRPRLAGDEKGDAKPSLADRIRALQQAAGRI